LFLCRHTKDDPVLPSTTNAIHYNEISLFGCFASNLQHYHQALEMISRDDIPWDRLSLIGSS